MTMTYDLKVYDLAEKWIQRELELRGMTSRDWDIDAIHRELASILAEHLQREIVSETKRLFTDHLCKKLAPPPWLPQKEEIWR